jgi:hypothetical protein
MRLGIVSIQRGRARYLVEWIAFHQAVGFERFYLYTDEDDSDQLRLTGKLAKTNPNIQNHVIKGGIPFNQVAVYQHAWNNYKRDCDYIAFIDGDEFLFSPDWETSFADTVDQLFNEHRNRSIKYTLHNAVSEWDACPI